MDSESRNTDYWEKLENQVRGAAERLSTFPGSGQDSDFVGDSQRDNIANRLVLQYRAGDENEYSASKSYWGADKPENVDMSFVEEYLSDQNVAPTVACTMAAYVVQDTDIRKEDEEFFFRIDPGEDGQELFNDYKGFQSFPFR